MCECTGMTPQAPDDTRALLTQLGLFAPIDLPESRLHNEAASWRDPCPTRRENENGPHLCRPLI